MQTPETAGSEPGGRSGAAPAPRRSLRERSPAQVRAALRGFPPACVDAALRYRTTGSVDDAWAMLPGMIAVHLPRGATPPPVDLADTLRLEEDLGLDSLARMEMAFRLEDLLGFAVESGDVAEVATVGDLRRFLEARLRRAAAVVAPCGANPRPSLP